MLKVLFLSKIYPACHLDVNRIKLGSNSIMTVKHTAEHSKAACLGIYWPECDVFIAHTTIKPEVSISLTEMPFFILQVNFQQVMTFVIGVSLKYIDVPGSIIKTILTENSKYLFLLSYELEHYTFSS